MMIGVAPQENHATGHHLFRIDVRHFEAEHLRVEGSGSFEVADLQHTTMVTGPRRPGRTRWSGGG